MGLHIYTSFQTPEGFLVSDVYCRIVEFTFRPKSPGQFFISFRTEFYIDREARLSGRLPIRTPTLRDGQTCEGVFGDMTYLYGLLKTDLEGAGFTVEDVIDEPVPTEPVPTEPVPTEPSA